MCCGGARTGRGQVPTRGEARGGANAPAAVRFTYVGQTSMTAIGSATGRLYRFDGPGITLAVDRRDAYSLGTVPVLRRDTA
jgi:hypothetical protein